MNALSQLFKPLAYLKIKHPTKNYFDWWIPLFTAVFLTAFFYFVVGSPKLFGSEGVITGVVALLEVLVGFYIAALAAIATFQKDGLDERMAGDQVTLEEQYRGAAQLVELTRRRFLCYLFGYLAWLSIALYFIGILATASHDSIAAMIEIRWREIAAYLGLFFYLFVLSNLFVTTMLGLYYMAHRLHLQEPKDLGVGSNKAIEPVSSRMVDQSGEPSFDE